MMMASNSHARLKEGEKRKEIKEIETKKEHRCQTRSNNSLTVKDVIASISHARYKEEVQWEREEEVGNQRM